ncbi:MAG: putative zinc-binding metallopeptidase [Hyphomonadaceae bacterium]|nr:putative zinc-binding metallopeptidase [Hyphomonadaceae bacterium]
MSKARRGSGRAETARWTDLQEADLLELPLKNLKVRLEGTWLADCLADVNDELRKRGLKIKIHGWISDEWFSPPETPGIAFPFYLAHPRLRRLERKMMLEVEGGTRRECMQLLRHEAGHVVEYAFGLHKRKRFQRLFGRASAPYPDHYRPDPSSKKHVQHLRRWYAQCHPDEDFAETFAVWLTPRSNWKKRYAAWPKALEKLEYIDELMAEIAGEKPAAQKRFEVDPVSKHRITLGEHYAAKRERYAIETPTVFDRELRKMFPEDARKMNAPQASSIIRKNRARIIRAVAKRTGEFPLALNAAIDDMISRCNALKLRSPRGETTVRAEITAMLSSKAIHTHYLATRRHWFAV